MALTLVLTEENIEKPLLYIVSERGPEPEFSGHEKFHLRNSIFI
jgi:hypothetical protein